MNEIKIIVDNIIGDDEDVIVNIPLRDLIWTIVCYSKDMSVCENKIRHEPDSEDLEYLIRLKEYTTYRRDELSRLINQYSDFNIIRIWDEVDKLVRYKNIKMNGE